MRLIALIVTMAIEIIFVSLIANDPLKWFPDEDGMAKIEQKYEQGKFTRSEAQAEKVQYFCVFWIVVGICKLFCGFKTAIISLSLSIPTFIVAYELNASGPGTAFKYGFISFIVVFAFLAWAYSCINHPTME